MLIYMLKSGGRITRRFIVCRYAVRRRINDRIEDASREARDIINACAITAGGVGVSLLRRWGRMETILG